MRHPATLRCADAAPRPRPGVRRADRDLLAHRQDRRSSRDVLRAAGPDEVEVVASYLAGAPRQRRTGLGWRGLEVLPDACGGAHAHGRRGRRGCSSGSARTAGSGLARGAGGAGRGAVRPGDGGGAAVPPRAGVREPPAGRPGLGAARRGRQGRRRAGGRGAAGRDVHPVLGRGGAGRADRWAGGAGRASGWCPAGRSGRCSPRSAPGRRRRRWRRWTAPCLVDRKLDGIRVQVHRVGDEVRVYTRSLDDVTDRLPGGGRGGAGRCPSATVVLDGEVIALRPDGRPRPVPGDRLADRQLARTSAARERVPLTSYFFDVLHLDGRDLLDEPAARAARRADARRCPRRSRCRGSSPTSVEEAQAFFDETIAARPRGRRGEVAGGAVRGGAPRARAGSRSSRGTPSTWWCSRSSGAAAGGSGMLSNIHLGAARPGDRRLRDARARRSRA